MMSSLRGSGAWTMGLQRAYWRQVTPDVRMATTRSSSRGRRVQAQKLQSQVVAARVASGRSRNQASATPSGPASWENRLMSMRYWSNQSLLALIGSRRRRLLSAARPHHCRGAFFGRTTFVPGSASPQIKHDFGSSSVDTSHTHSGGCAIFVPPPVPFTIASEIELSPENGSPRSESDCDSRTMRSCRRRTCSNTQLLAFSASPFSASLDPLGTSSPSVATDPPRATRPTHSLNRRRRDDIATPHLTVHANTTSPHHCARNDIRHY
mmetsp:Transcript_7751/g.23669  ORF Transcript_7751/g.23669 Transcript_7751/m.23669 type:complete len:266 (-) Transcript_7751:120-917(-)